MNLQKEKNLHICRLCLSSYQRENYLELEAEALKDIPFLSYSLTNLPDQGDLILITNTNYDFSQLPPQVIARVKLIIHPNSGYDNISYEFASMANFPIIIGNPIRANAVVEYTLSCLFDFFSSVPFHSQWQPGRNWPRKLLANQKIQLFGHGHIGKVLAKILRELSEEIYIYDPPQGFEELNLEQCNVVIFANALQKETFQFFNQSYFEKLHLDILIINGARGKLIEQNSLIQFLESHPQAFAYLDVFKQEPFENEFKHLNNVRLSSHIAGVYNDLDKEIANYVAKVSRDFVTMENSDFLESYKNLNLKNFSQNSFLN